MPAAPSLRTSVYDIREGAAGKPAKSSKYDKHIKSAPFYTKKEIRERKKRDPNWEASPLISVQGIKDFGGVDICVVLRFIREPFTMVDKTHAHNFHQYLGFMGANPEDPMDFGGEAEICFGKEGEKYIINKPQAIHIAPQLVHGTLKFTKIDKPLLYLAVNTSPFYARTAEYD